MNMNVVTSNLLRFLGVVAIIVAAVGAVLTSTPDNVSSAPQTTSVAVVSVAFGTTADTTVIGGGGTVGNVGN